MRFSLTPFRVITFLGLVGLFALLGGFSFPDVDFQSRHVSEAASESWLIMIGTFLVGAASVCLIDHDFCYFAPVSLRPFYIFVGTLAMILAIAWLFYVRDAWESQLGQSRYPGDLPLANLCEFGMLV